MCRELILLVAFEPVDEGNSQIKQTDYRQPEPKTKTTEKRKIMTDRQLCTPVKLSKLTTSKTVFFKNKTSIKIFDIACLPADFNQKVGFSIELATQPGGHPAANPEPHPTLAIPVLLLSNKRRFAH